MKQPKQFAVMHPAALMAAHEVVKNSPLNRIIQESMNPYHALHVAKAYQLKAPRVSAINVPHSIPNTPWLMMKGKK